MRQHTAPDDRNLTAPFASRTGKFGVTVSCTENYAKFAVASICSIRDHNATVAIELVLDRQFDGLGRIAERVGFEIRTISPDQSIVPETEHVRSRMLKIQAVASTAFDPMLYIDADTLALTDVARIQSALSISADADLFMLLRRPLVPTIWDYGRLNFVDPKIDDSDIVTLLRSTFGLAISARDLDHLKCWNAGVIFGSQDVVCKMATKWLATYERMIRVPTSRAFVPNDQLCLWLTLWEAGNTIRVGELPLSWNFMPGHVLRMKPYTRQIDPSALAEVAILHLATNKYDEWALRMIEAALDRHDASLAWNHDKL
jgi:hypothetical protein